MARPRLLRRIEKEPVATYYKPQGIPLRQLEELNLTIEGFEALRLADVLQYNQENAAQKMKVSKATFCRILAEARTVVATALTEGYALRIAGGNYVMDSPSEEGQPRIFGKACPMNCTRKVMNEQE